MSSEKAGRTWRVTAGINFPTEIVALEPPEEGESLPKRIGHASRVRRQSIEIAGVTVSLREWNGPGLPEGLGAGHGEEAAELLVEPIEGSDPFEILGKADPVLESVLDRLSFDLQHPIRVFSLRLLDITPPLQLGEKRDFEAFGGNPLDKFARSVPLLTSFTVRSPQLALLDHSMSSRARAALRWYLKGLGAPYQQDQFLFFWIALEIFADESGTAEEHPYRARCGHEIPYCPSCEAPTAQKVRGASLRKYLRERFGIDEETSRRLWKMRQLMHGAIPFDAKELAELPTLVALLRSIVVQDLKEALNLDQETSPVVEPAGLSVHPVFGVGGTTEIREEDFSGASSGPG